ncbi:hypothetical protein HETIRDRAFT_451826 [Heterobasidion irregulare TC 32-1]|uniref:Uncharacterized protein n=1 Tax=Heterobasidion irregulare (strain TC 32-1) TaxID=747525 RepID=W4K908_HETIT|nr:uncharacterized protein HETIRDRAFT_451826 [Heterobasidion irregulare TC 32-1]ETW82268.1 hypothetical protein HETIRDRAFT_451826 [Heterobasidion irregulare TC 32-1]
MVVVGATPDYRAGVLMAHEAIVSGGVERASQAFVEETRAEVQVEADAWTCKSSRRQSASSGTLLASAMRGSYQAASAELDAINLPASNHAQRRGQSRAPPPPSSSSTVVRGVAFDL